MKNLKYIILIVVVLIIIIIVSLLLILNINESKSLEEQQNDYLDVINNPGYSIIGLKPEITKLDSVYFSIDACIEKMLTNAKLNNNEAILNLITKEKIEENHITKENVQNKLGIINIKTYKTKEVYELVGTNYASYYVRIITEKGNIYFNINWDMKTSSFDLNVINKEEFEQYINKTIGEKDVQSKEKSIERNSYNSIPYKHLEEMDVAKKYLLDYVNNAVNFPEEAYNSLDEEYKKAKFGSINNFKQFVQNNTRLQKLYKSANSNPENYTSGIEYFISQDEAKLEQYSRKEKEGYTEYICIDTFGNYYTFKVTAPMQYTLILDTYTINIPEFTEKYKASNEQEKVILNLNKFMLAINDKDYKYAYSVLADSFKEKNFKTYESFENYAKTNFFSENKFEYTKFGSEAGTYYTYTVKIEDNSKVSKNNITKTFIMLLEEGTNFKLSFNI